MYSGLCSFILNHCWLETWGGKLHWGSAWIGSSWNLQGSGGYTSCINMLDNNKAVDSEVKIYIKATFNDSRKHICKLIGPLPLPSQLHITLHTFWHPSFSGFLCDKAYMLVQFWRPAEPFYWNWHAFTGLWTVHSSMIGTDKNRRNTMRIHEA